MNVVYARVELALTPGKTAIGILLCDDLVLGLPDQDSRGWSPIENDCSFQFWLLRLTERFEPKLQQLSEKRGQEFLQRGERVVAAVKGYYHKALSFESLDKIYSDIYLRLDPSVRSKIDRLVMGPGIMIQNGEDYYLSVLAIIFRFSVEVEDAEFSEENYIQGELGARTQCLVSMLANECGMWGQLVFRAYTMGSGEGQVTNLDKPPE